MCSSILYYFFKSQNWISSTANNFTTIRSRIYIFPRAETYLPIQYNKHLDRGWTTSSCIPVKCWVSPFYNLMSLVVLFSGLSSRLLLHCLIFCIYYSRLTRYLFTKLASSLLLQEGNRTASSSGYFYCFLFRFIIRFIVLIIILQTVIVPLSSLLLRCAKPQPPAGSLRAAMKWFNLLN